MTAAELLRKVRERIETEKLGPVLGGRAAIFDSTVSCLVEDECLWLARFLMGKCAHYRRKVSLAQAATPEQGFAALDRAIALAEAEEQTEVKP